MKVTQLGSLLFVKDRQECFTEKPCLKTQKGGKKKAGLLIESPDSVDRFLESSLYEDRNNTYSLHLPN